MAAAVNTVVIAAKPAVPPLGAPKSPVIPGSTGGGSVVPQQGTRFLQHIKPKKVSQAIPANHILVVGNKGCKTVAAVAVPIQAGMTANGRAEIIATPGLPIPPGSRKVIVTFDNQTSQSLLNHYGPQFGDDIDIISLMDPVVEDCPGTGDHAPPATSDDAVGWRCEKQHKVLYPGWDGGNPKNGSIVAEALKEVLSSFKLNHDVGLLLMDRYDKFLEEVLKYHAYAMAGAKLDDKLEPSDWTSRANKTNDIDDLVRNCVMPGGWVIATGQRDMKDGNAVTTFKKDRKDEHGNPQFAKKEVVPSKWMEKILHNWPNVIQVFKVRGERSTDFSWSAEVEEGRHPFFPLGAVVDIKGRHIGAFLDKEAVIYPEDRDKAKPAAPSSSQTTTSPPAASRSPVIPGRK